VPKKTASQNYTFLVQGFCRWPGLPWWDCVTRKTEVESLL